MEYSKKNKKLFIAFTCIITLIISIHPLFSQEFRATVNRNPVSAGERFQVTYTFEGDGSNFQGPSFKDFTYIGGPSQSQSIQIINGRMTKSLSYSYVLLAGNPGTYTIPAASILVDGKKIYSNTITLNVVKSQQDATQQQQRTETEQVNEVIRKNLFLTLSLSKTDVYLGEALIATYKLYKHPNLMLVNLSNPQTTLNAGFWLQDIESIGQINWSNEVMDGVNYQVAVLKKQLLIPQRTGNLTIEPLELDAVVRLRMERPGGRRSFFDDFFDNPFSMGTVRDFEHKIKSRSGQVRVKALPDNTPDGFNGAVGNISMKAWFDKIQTHTNEPVTLKIQLSGTGNLKLIEPINPLFPSDFDYYDPKSVDNLSASASGFSGSKTFEYLLIPRHSGTYQIEPFTFSYFDLSSKQYKTLTGGPFTITVEKGEASEETTLISGVRKEEIKYLGKDILYIKTKATFDHNNRKFFGSTLHYLLSIAPLAMFILFFIVRRKAIKERRDKALMLNKMASRTAKKSLNIASQYLKKGDKNLFYEEVSRALWVYLSSKLNIPFAELNKEIAINQLKEKNIPEELTNQTFETIDKCEFARFAPIDGTPDMQEIYHNASYAITAINNRLK